MGWSHKVSAGFPINLHFVQTLQVVLHYAEVQSNITACCMHLHWSSLTIRYMHSERDAWQQLLAVVLTEVCTDAGTGTKQTSLLLSEQS